MRRPSLRGRRRQPAVPTAPGLGAVVRGGWTGFVVLFVGDLVTLYHGRGDGLVLYWVAAAAYAVAGNRAAAPSAGVGRTAARDGAGAAMGAYLLTIPLRSAAGGSVTLVGTVVALAAALLIGGGAGAIAASARRRRPAPHSGPSSPPVVGGPVQVAGRWPVTRDILELPDGRQVQWIAAGPADGIPLVLHHGTPGACGAWRGAVGAAGDAGFRLVVHSRPGYGGSSARPGRRIVDTAADVAALLDALGAEHFVTVGWSTGGPHALACAAGLPGRCTAAAVISGPAPRLAAGLDWLEGMEEDSAAEYQLADSGREALEEALVPVASDLAGLGTDELCEVLGELLADVDQRALAGPFADYLAATYRSGLSAGAAGWRDDDLALVAPWGFDPGRLQVPVGLWWGTEDRLVPSPHGRWMARHVPGATAHECPGEGHLSIVQAVLSDVVATLAVHAGR